MGRSLSSFQTPLSLALQPKKPRFLSVRPLFSHLPRKAPSRTIGHVSKVDLGPRCEFGGTLGITAVELTRDLQDAVMVTVPVVSTNISYVGVAVHRGGKKRMASCSENKRNRLKNRTEKKKCHQLEKKSRVHEL